MSKISRYSPELRERAVRMVAENRNDYRSRWADFTTISKLLGMSAETHTGWVYVAFIIDVFRRFIVGWQISTSLRSDLAIDALEMSIYSRNGEGLSHLVQSQR